MGTRCLCPKENNNKETWWIRSYKTAVPSLALWVLVSFQNSVAYPGGWWWGDPGDSAWFSWNPAASQTMRAFPSCKWKDYVNPRFFPPTKMHLLATRQEEYLLLTPAKLGQDVFLGHPQSPGTTVAFFRPIRDLSVWVTDRSNSKSQSKQGCASEMLNGFVKEYVI